MKRKTENSPEKVFNLTENKTVSLANSLNHIYKTVDRLGLSDETLKSLETEVRRLAEHFGIDDKAVVLLAGILANNNTAHCMDEEDLAGYLGCSNIELIGFYPRLREMEKLGVISSNCNGKRSFRVTPEALRSVERNRAFVPVKMTDLLPDELFYRFRECFIRFKKDKIDTDVLIEELDALVHDNQHLVFCRKAAESPIYGSCSDTQRRIFYYLCSCYVTLGKPSIQIDILLNLTDFAEESQHLRRIFSNETATIQTNRLVEFANEDGMVDTESLSLSDEVRETFFTEVSLTPEAKVSCKDLIGAEAIQAKELFYNEAEGAQISRLAGLLEASHFKGIQDRLTEKGMRKGFNVLFYGAPGTGKTASAFELARQNGRDIFFVDMSKLKSKWVGESEKSVKGVFKMYRDLCRTREKVPILLFNEADAIFMRRFENVEHSVDQMNNAIQNIILQEMENLEGILIATTNLPGNLDPAFERRFLYKVEFTLPEHGVRLKIWKSMLSELSDRDAEILASSYEFSGGNIENIARKITVEYILSGEKPCLETLRRFCEEETYNCARRQIGF